MRQFRTRFVQQGFHPAGHEIGEERVEKRRRAREHSQRGDSAENGGEGRVKPVGETHAWHTRSFEAYTLWSRRGSDVRQNSTTYCGGASISTRSETSCSAAGRGTADVTRAACSPLGGLWALRFRPGQWAAFDPTHNNSDRLGLSPPGCVGRGVRGRAAARACRRAGLVHDISRVRGGARAREGVGVGSGHANPRCERRVGALHGGHVAVPERTV